MAYDLLALTPNPWVVYAFIAILGACVGSFCNVVIYRLPIMLSLGKYADGKRLGELKAAHGKFNLSVPGSACPCCGAKVKPWYNVPVLGWLVLRGKCASCRSPISGRYIVVEMLIALLWLMLVLTTGLSPSTICTLVLGSLSFCLTGIYAEHSAVAKPLAYCWIAAFVGLVVTAVLTAPVA